MIRLGEKRPGKPKRGKPSGGKEKKKEAIRPLYII
jgi:hypothetical protein